MLSMHGQQQPFSMWTVVLERIKIFMKLKIAHPWWDLNPSPLHYMLSAPTAELQECYTFQFIVWDTGSGNIDIFVYKG